MMAAPAERNPVRTRCQRMTAPGPTRRKKNTKSAHRGRFSCQRGSSYPHKCWAALQSQQSSTTVEAKHFIPFALWVITGKTAVRPVYDTLTVAERILEPHMLDRMSDEADGCVGGKPARIDRVVTGVRGAGDVPAQECKNRYARGSRVRGYAG